MYNTSQNYSCSNNTGIIIHCPFQHFLASLPISLGLLSQMLVLLDCCSTGNIGRKLFLMKGQIYISQRYLQWNQSIWRLYSVVNNFPKYILSSSILVQELELAGRTTYKRNQFWPMQELAQFIYRKQFLHWTKLVPISA